ncbi:MAG: hypothetical protein ACKOQ3_11365 [Novosphingobium sp.]
MDITIATGGAGSAFQTIKDNVTFLLAALGGGVALWRYWDDQRWKKKQFAYDYAERMLADERALSALRMLDWTNGRFSQPIIEEFELGPDKQGRGDPAETYWDQADVVRALRHHGPSASEPLGAAFSPREYAIRSLFDHALSYFERLGEFVRTRVISKRDFPNTLAYYITLLDEPRLADLRGPLLGYMETYRYTSTLLLFRRFLNDAPRASAQVPAQPAAQPQDLHHGDGQQP